MDFDIGLELKKDESARPKEKSYSVKSVRLAKRMIDF